MIVSENPLSAPAKRSQGIPPTVLVLLSIGSVQFGAAIAKGLFDSLGPGGTVFLRISLATLALLLLWRPKLGAFGRATSCLARVGGAFPGGAGLVISLAVGTVVLLPVGMVDAGYALDPWLLLAGLGPALLSSAVPYSLEMQALRCLPTRVFGVLMSLEPAVATLVGFAVLNELLDLRAVAAVVLVTAAAAGASFFASQGAPG
jgi:threonine/homoserine efflux transporter RhtA